MIHPSGTGSLLSLSLLLFLLLPNLSRAQGDWCGSDEKREELIQRIGADRLHQSFQEAKQKGVDRAAPDTIPVVIHVIHDGGIGNISYEQIKDGIRVLNEDFNRVNSDTNETRPVFDSLAADSRIVFRLARYGPNGQCTNGVTRTRSDLTYNANNAVKELIRWPTDQYFNFWLANQLENSGGNTLLGYADFPFGGIDDNYGVVMRNDRFGTIGTSNSGGRTATHEVGHCLGLFHTFQGDGCGGNCSDTGDNLCDTPPTAQSTFGCDQTQNSCSNDTQGPSPYNSDVVDQIENYMSYDACQNMFSRDQKDVMKGVLDNINGLQNLVSTSNLEATGVHTDPLCKADLKAEKRIICAGESIQFRDLSYHKIQERTWIFSGGDPFFSVNDPKPVITYQNPGLYDVQLEVRQGNDTASVHEEGLIRVLDSTGTPVPYKEDMEDRPIANEQLFPRESFGSTEWALTDRTGASGNSSLIFENYLATPGESYEVETRPIDASGVSDVALSFKVAYRQTDSSDQDVLKVYASNSCGSSWSLRKILSADELRNGPPKDAFYLAEGETTWKTFRVEQPLAFGYNVEGLRFKFRLESDGGNNIYLDDINVAHPDVLSIEEGSSSLGVDLYPNPSTDKVTLRMEGGNAFTLKLRDASGRTLRKRRIAAKNGQRKERISVKELSAGLYFLHFERGGRTQQVQKLMVR
ncbi:MAG: M43 family zinc metalloprotease [Flavobacteriales bacterium]